MSEHVPTEPQAPEPDESHYGARRIAYWFSTRAGGILIPIASTVLAFLVAGIVVALTGHNPLGTYKAIFDGTGLNFLFPWLSPEERRAAASDLQQTLIVTTPLILTACAVAFAFRCGMFNIGGNGQFICGLVASLFVGSHFEGLPRPLHVFLALAAALLAGAVWGGIAGILRATRGAHEVITTIMLNFIALYGAKYLFELGGPLQGSDPSIPRSDDIFASAQLWQIWGRLQPLHAGIFVALAGVLVYHLLLNRTTLGYEVRAVGFNPEAARYGGISVGKNYFLALAISGGFAGLAGAVDLLGWKYHLATNDLDAVTVGFIGIAVALLGRNKAVGILCAALLFGALQVGTSPRQLDPTVFPPELAGNLATMIQALIILFIGAELLIVYMWGLRRRIDWAGPSRVGGDLTPDPDAVSTVDATAENDRLRRLTEPGSVAILGIVLGCVALLATIPPFAAEAAGVPIAIGLAGVAAGLWAWNRDERRLAAWAIGVSVFCAASGLWLQGRDAASLQDVFNAGLLAATLRFATPLAFAAIGGIFNERSGVVNIGLEGMMLAGAFFGIWAAAWSGSWVVGLAFAMLAGGSFALVHAFFSIHLRADQIVVGTGINLLAFGLTGYLFRYIYGPRGTPADISRIPDVHLGFVKDVPYVGDIFGQLNLMIWLMLILVVLSWVVIFKTPIGLRLRSVGEHPRAADTVGISVYGVRYAAVILSGMLAALGGAYLSIAFTGTFNELMSAGRGYIALAAVIFGKWNPFGAFGACLLFGFASAISIPLQREADISANLLSTLPYVLTLVALVGVIGRSVGPAAVGRPYTKQ